MGKYGGGHTYNEICKMELKELEEILSKYDISQEDKENIKSMVTEGYFQAHNLAKGGRVLETILKENNIDIDFQHYLELEHEEGLKYIFDANEDAD